MQAKSRSPVPMTAALKPQMHSARLGLIENDVTGLSMEEDPRQPMVPTATNVVSFAVSSMASGGVRFLLLLPLEGVCLLLLACMFLCCCCCTAFFPLLGCCCGRAEGLGICCCPFVTRILGHPDSQTLPKETEKSKAHPGPSTAEPYQ